MLTGLVWAGLAMAQDSSGEQALRRVIELQRSGHYAEAIAGYETYLKSHPEAAAVRSNLGAALAHEGRYAEAVRQYTLALKAQDSNYGIRFNLGLAYYKQDDVASAVKEFKTVYAAMPAEDPERRRVALLLAGCYLSLGEDDQVISLLNPIADADPNDLAAAYLLGTALLHRGQEQRGALMIDRILHNGDTAQAHMLMAYTRLKANDKKGARDEVTRALALNPNLPEAYSFEGRLNFIASDIEGAKAAFRKALALDPNSFESLLFLGALLREEGQLKEARPLLDRGLRLQPKEPRIRYQSALEYSGEGDDARAATMLESLIKDASDYTEAHRSLSTIYFRLGRTEDGKRERQTAEKLDAAIQAQDQATGRTLK
jgi:tetratricopeptide (TPR) repeat protein